ncbi:CopG family transcriptional regulator [Vibrio cincinnatiensis]
MIILPKPVGNFYRLISRNKFELIAHYLITSNYDIERFKYNNVIFNMLDSDMRPYLSNVEQCIKEEVEKIKRNNEEDKRKDSVILEGKVIEYINKIRCESIISESDVCWIKKDNPRQCMYLLSMILFSDELNGNVLDLFSDDYFIIEKVIRRLGGVEGRSILNYFNPRIVHDIRLMYEHILFYFMTLPKHRALIQISFLKKAWSNTVQENDHDWINSKDEQQVNWIIEYYHKKRIELWFVNHNGELLRKYISCINILDLWKKSEYVYNIGSKDYFLEKMKKSWSQQKYRLKKNKKKQISFQVEADTDRMLKKLCKELNITKSQLLEDAINKLKNSELKPK